MAKSCFSEIYPKKSQQKPNIKLLNWLVVVMTADSFEYMNPLVYEIIGLYWTEMQKNLGLSYQ